MPETAVVVLTGPPGAGKSTVARLLADSWPASVHLHSDDCWYYIRQGRIAPYLPQAHRQNQTVMDALAQAAFTYAAGGYQVICDGIVRPWFIDVFRTAAAARAIPRPTTSSCARTRPPRCAGDRPGGLALADPEPIRSLHRHFTDIGEFGRHVIDSTQLSQQATTDAVRRGLDEGTYLLS